MKYLALIVAALPAFVLAQDGAGGVNPYSEIPDNPSLSSFTTASATSTGVLPSSGIEANEQSLSSSGSSAATPSSSSAVDSTSASASFNPGASGSATTPETTASPSPSSGAGRLQYPIAGAAIVAGVVGSVFL